MGTAKTRRKRKKKTNAITDAERKDSNKQHIKLIFHAIFEKTV